MSWNLWPTAAPDLLEPDDEASDLDELALEPMDDPLGTVQVLTPGTSTEETPGCWHVRPVPSCETPRSMPARREPDLRRQRPPEQPDLRGIGLPEHLVPPRGGIFELLALLERTPRARLPSLRPGDEVVVVTVLSHDGHRGSTADTADTGGDVRRALAAHGAEVDEVDIHVFAWPDETDPGRMRASEAAAVEQVRSIRARLEFLAVHPDCPGTVAYAACRSLPTAQLYLTGVLGAQRPAAPLGWGAPVAFVDGRPADPAVLAAILADRLAGGVA